ncbi:hypothetical protein [Lyngbya aestuarii]|uniref:hypothetical protein n=1 Tax=Lyngbya aestuarii TaxID=118322 RepID=UPI00403DFEC7
MMKIAKSFLGIAIPVIGYLLLVVGYSYQFWQGKETKKTQEVTLKSVDGEKEESAAVTTDSTPGTRKEYEQQLEAKLTKYFAWIDSLKVKLQTADNKAQAKIRPELVELEKRTEALKLDSDALRSSSAPLWGERKSDIDAEIKDLDQSFTKIENRLQAARILIKGG